MEITWTERNMEQGILNGIMDLNIRGNLNKVIHTVKAKSWIQPKTITTKANFNTDSLTVKVNKQRRMWHIKGNSWKERGADLEGSQ